MLKKLKNPSQQPMALLDTTLTQPDLKLGADWLACAPPEVTEEFLGSLSDNA